MSPAFPHPIQELPEPVVHKIAAGEVVERPVSVVKELIENSIDAGATRIHVEISKGGMETIAVSDDGCGIRPQDLVLALKRHATSKIRSAEDLFSLQTLGFRGEALPSIASVCRFRLESATEATAPLGYFLEVEAGRRGELQEASRSRGTRVVVRDLFSTVPARLKFLKRPETEWGHIYDLLTALALNHLGIEWRLDHNGKQSLFCPRSSDFRARVLDLFGREAMEALYPLERTTAEIKLRGLISHPNFSQKSNRQIFVFVNGRYVQDRLINHAILSGYRGLLMTQQYPMVVLELEMKTDLVDVNVHPTKREVRFANSNVVHHLISETIRRALETAPWRQEGTPRGSETSRFEETPTIGGQEGLFFQGKGSQQGVQQALSEFARRQGLGSEPDFQPEAKIGTLPFHQLKLLGQLNTTYLVCENEGSLILIDQHAAHERIGFERLRKSFYSGKIPQQILLHPLSFELREGQAQILGELAPQLEKFGLDVEAFGGKSFVLKAYPSLLGGCDGVRLILDLVEKLEEEGRIQGLEDRIEHVLATMACHRQIRAGDRLHPEEMESLLRELEDTPRSYHCPHGRPVMVEIEAREIEKWFKRVL